MKLLRRTFFRFVPLSVMAMLLLTVGVTVQAQGTAFTYQGKLNDNGAPASGTYDFQFKLFDALMAGNQVGSTNSLTNVAVSSGVFSVTLDFGAAAFPGANRWLEISARLAGSGVFTTLSPRQPITSTPYAIKSLSATTADGVSTALRTETTAYTPNLIGGFLGTGSGGATPGNRVTAGVVGASIGGGGFNGTMNLPSGGSLIGDLTNRVTDWLGTVAGGVGNRAGNDSGTLDDALLATVGGGYVNTASGTFSTVAGGSNNIASDTSATVGGGSTNSAVGAHSTVIGGTFNAASGTDSTVAGGYFNIASGNSSFAAGRQAKSAHNGTFVWADALGTDFLSTNNNQFLIRASGGVGIGTNSPAATLDVAGRIALNNNLFHLRDGSDPNHGMIYSSVVDGPEFRAFGGFRWTRGFSGAIELMRITSIGTVQPGSDNTQDFGGGTLRWKALFAANGLIQTSDARLKKSVTQLGYGLQQIMQLRPVSFQWKDRDDGRTHLGLIAQEVEKLIPEAVERDTDPATPLGMNYASLVPVLVKAIQEQQGLVKQQQEQLRQQQTEIKLLKQLVCAQQPRATFCQ